MTTQFRRTMAITVPVLSFKRRDVAYVRIEAALRQSEKFVSDDKDSKPAMLARVTDLETGEMFDMICPSLLVTALEEKAGDYVGRCFEVHVSAEPREGKKYKDVSLYEIECPGDSGDAA